MIQTPKISKKDNEFTEHLKIIQKLIFFCYHIPQKHNNTHKNLYTFLVIFLFVFCV